MQKLKINLNLKTTLKLNNITVLREMQLNFLKDCLKNLGRF